MPYDDSQRTWQRTPAEVAEAVNTLEAQVSALAAQDTGWRAVTGGGTIGILPNFIVLVRRVGQVVSVLTVQGPTNATGTNYQTVYTFPTGFRPAMPSGSQPLPAGVVIHPSSALPVAGSTVYTNNANELVIYAVSGQRHNATLTFVTADAFPTSLPGSAV